MKRKLNNNGKRKEKVGSNIRMNPSPKKNMMNSNMDLENQQT
jgi:hypothetical protein